MTGDAANHQLHAAAPRDCRIGIVTIWQSVGSTAISTEHPLAPSFATPVGDGLRAVRSLLNSSRKATIPRSSVDCSLRLAVQAVAAQSTTGRDSGGDRAENHRRAASRRAEASTGFWIEKRSPSRSAAVSVSPQGGIGTCEGDRLNNTSGILTRPSGIAAANFRQPSQEIDRQRPTDRSSCYNLSCRAADGTLLRLLPQPSTNGTT